MHPREALDRRQIIRNHRTAQHSDQLSDGVWKPNSSRIECFQKDNPSSSGQQKLVWAIPAHAVMTEHDRVDVGIKPILNRRSPFLLPALERAAADEDVPMRRILLCKRERTMQQPTAL